MVEADAPAFARLCEACRAIVVYDTGKRQVMNLEEKGK